MFRDALGRRLAPLYLSSFFGGLALWVPIEKLFMTQIGFTSASVGIMAAVYAVVVPVLEVPSGLLADRWSRRGVLILATVAVIISVLIGGFSQNVIAYMVAAAFLGVFFALQSGTLESIVYDTVLEETGDSEAFERTMGRVRLVESAALVASALAGGLIAQFAPLRATYFLTAPLLVLSALMLLWFREPQLHKTGERDSLRGQILATYRMVLGGGHLRAIVALTVVGALLMQGMLEFGPLWLVALLVPPFLYGPHWAGLTAALGLGGLLGARPWFTRALDGAGPRRGGSRLLCRTRRERARRPRDRRPGRADAARRGGQHPGDAAAPRHGAVHHPRGRRIGRGDAHVAGLRAVRASPSGPSARPPDWTVVRGSSWPSA